MEVIDACISYCGYGLSSFVIGFGLYTAWKYYDPYERGAAALILSMYLVLTLVLVTTVKEFLRGSVSEPSEFYSGLGLFLSIGYVIIWLAVSAGYALAISTFLRQAKVRLA